MFSFSDIELLEDSGIPTEAFLASCYAVVPVLDKLGPTVFAPVKMDLVGNIKVNVLACLCRNLSVNEWLFTPFVCEKNKSKAEGVTHTGNFQWRKIVE